jgi:hypothetical protein
MAYMAPMQVMSFFTSLGFNFPARKDLGSWLMELTTPAGEVESLF